MKGIEIGRNLALVLMVCVLMVAAIAVWHDLGTMEVLGRDENATITKLDQPDLQGVLKATSMKVTGQPGNMQPLYFVLQYTAWPLVGRSAFVFRFLPSLFGLLSVALTFKLGEALWSRQVGVAGALLTALLPLHVRYAQIARPYTLLVLLSLASAYLLIRGLKDNRPGQWAGFALTAALGFYTHYNALMYLAAEALFAGVIWIATLVDVLRARQAAKRLLAPALGFLLLGVFCAPGIVRLGNLSVTESTRGIQVELTAGFFSWLLYKFGLSSNLRQFLFVGSAALGLGAGVYQRRWRSALFSLLWLTVPFFVLASIQAPRRFEERYVIFLAPVGLLLTGQGIAFLAGILGRLGQRWDERRVRIVGIAALTAAMALLLVGPLQGLYSANRGSNRLGETVEAIERQAQPGDLIIVSPRFFVRRLNVEGADILYLTEHLSRPAFDALVEENRRAWILYTSYLPPVELQEALDQWIQAEPGKFARVPIKSTSALAFRGAGPAGTEAFLQDQIAVLEDLAAVSYNDQEAWFRYGALADAYEALGGLYDGLGETALADAYRQKAEDARASAPRPW